MWARRPASLLLVVSLLLAFPGCGGTAGSTGSASAGGSATASPPGSPSPSARHVRIVALGDSDATGEGDPTGQGWVGRYADLVKRGTGLSVTVDNRARSGKTSQLLRSEVTSDATTRQALQGAGIVLLGIGGADLNEGDDALAAGRCKGRACYQPLFRQFDGNLERVIAAVRELVGESAVLRAISLPNVRPGAEDLVPPLITADIALYQVLTEREIICRVVRKHGGECADVVRAFNGTSGTGDAYKTGLLTKDPCCYPSAKGQQLMADLVYRLGVAPLA